MIAERSAIVTGGASGLGTAIARELARRGAYVTILDRDRDAAEALADEIDAQVEVVDLLDADAAADAVARIAAEDGFDILVNNAGIDVTGPLGDLTQDDFDAVLSVNLRAPFALARAAFAHIRGVGGGAIVNIASTAAKRAWDGATAYHASKWGLLGLSHALHVEGRPLGIRVTAIIAGGMRTPFITERFPDVPLENLQEPSAVAGAVAFALAQPGNSVIPELTILPLTETSWP